MALKALKKVYIKFQKKRREKRYHRLNNKKAENGLEIIESENGRKLDPKTVQKCDEYAAEVLDWKGYAPWLYLYSAISGQFSEGWIPNNYYANVVIPKVNGSFGKLSDKKTLSTQLIRSESFPDILRSIKKKFYDNNYEVVGEEELPSFLFRETDKIVYKKDNSRQGRDVHVLKKENFSNFDTENIDDGIFQSFIQQHGFFDDICSSSVQTVRITTISKGDKAEVRAAYFRVGRTENTHVKSKSSLRLAIDINTGEIDERAYFPDWSTTMKHPDTDFVFKNKIIPQFSKAKELVVQLHKAIPYVGCVGWDVAINKNEEIEVMEWNGGQTAIVFSEALSGPCFADLGWENLWKTK